MRKEKQDARRKLIEEAAYKILSERGYRSSSMLLIAKKAKASNETLYRWYGSKQGLFTALVEENTRNIKEGLESCLSEHKDPVKTLETFGSALLQYIASPRSIALNRAAAAEADNSDLGTSLGDAIAKAEKETIAPLAETAFRAAAVAAQLPTQQIEEACRTYLTVLVGDTQIRRTIGILEPLSNKQSSEHARNAFKLINKMFEAEKSIA